ncbi:MAG: PAS domain S-box protein [Planctomycetota bacterium]|nr:MAG: PAS domain S-box protein [Planctomycetota bacterium]REK23414.1 MAG: PAS domain S-box protein [Planctomycetota bacterium]REK38949.1 MAG: PAS domain S-box protein [Planctomycetota bacterium]
MGNAYPEFMVPTGPDLFAKFALAAELVDAIGVASDVVLSAALAALAWIAFSRSRAAAESPLIWSTLSIVFVALGAAHLVQAVFVEPAAAVVGLTLKATATVAVLVGAIVLLRAHRKATSSLPPRRPDSELSGAGQPAASLQDERYLLHTLMTNLPEAIYFKDVQGRFIRISQGLAERLGLSDPSAAVGKSDADFFPSEYAQAAAEDERTVIESGRRIIDKPENPVWPTGGEEWVSTSKVPLYDAEGRVAGILGISHDITARHLAEQKLEAANERFALAVRGSTDGIWDWDVETSEVYYSPRMKELLGYEEHELEGVFEEFRSRLHPDDLERTMDAVRDHLERRVPYDVEYRLLTKSGEYRWFRARGQALWDETTGRATRMAGSITDITDRREAEAELRASEGRYRTLVENAPEAIVVLDADEGRFVEANQNAVDLFETSIGELLQAHPADLSPPLQPDGRPSLEAARSYIEAALRGESVAFDWVHRTSSGRDIPCEVRLVALPSRGRNVLRASIADISWRKSIERDLRDQIEERKRAERRLRRNVERTRRILETARDAFIAMDEEGRIVDWNPQAEETFGWTREEAIGRLLAETVVPPELRIQHSQGVQQFLETGEGPVLDRRIELPAIRRDGSQFPVELTITAIADGEGHLFASFLHDITGRKQAEAELEQARDDAEAANRAKSDFLANMSHEIRTPMNAVIGMTELVLDTDLTSTQRDYLNTVIESSESLLTIINEILDFSKIEAGKLELDPAPFDLREELGDAVKPLGVRASAKGIELAWRADHSVPECLVGDAARLRQVLINLVGNAIKFTTEGEVVATVDVDDRHDGRVTLHFAVQDTGIGISPDRQASIFDAFEQGDNSTTRRFGGTGLGLAIASRVVERMQGRIWVESTPNVGSTFHFTLPFEVSESSADATAANLDLSGRPVLVVDDNATNRTILLETLSAWKMDVQACAGGAEALEQLARSAKSNAEPPLILTDVNMPGMDGFEFVERVRAGAHFPDAKVIVLTSGTRTGDSGRIERLGVAATLIKPVKQSELRLAIARAAGGERDAAPVSDEGDGEAPDLPPLNILVAEDGLVNQQIAIGVLSRGGHTVEVADDGRAAVEAWQHGAYDLILMDVQMPVMDGLEATREIRTRERSTGNHIPIIAMTARAMPGDEELCLAAGMDAYLSKPVRRRQLYEAIAPFFPTGPESAAAAASPREERDDPGESRLPPEPGAAPAVDWDVALRTVGGDRGLLATIVAETRNELQTVLQHFERALREGDARATSRHAHTIKGLGRNLGGKPLMHTARRIEEPASEGDLGPANDLLDELRNEVRRFCDALESFDP